MSGSVSTSSGRANLIEAIMFCTYALFAVNWIAGTTLTPEIMKYFHLDSFMSATFISNAITVAKIIGNFCAAAILIKFLPKKAIAIGSGMIVFGSALAILAPQYWVYSLLAGSLWALVVPFTSSISALSSSIILSRKRVLQSMPSTAWLIM